MAGGVRGRVFLYATQQLNATETIDLPKGFAVVSPKQGTAVDETYASFEGTAAMKNSRFEIAQKVEVRRRQIPVGGYAGFRKASGESERLCRHGIPCGERGHPMKRMLIFLSAAVSLLITLARRPFSHNAPTTTGSISPGCWLRAPRTFDTAQDVISFPTTIR